MLAKTVTDDDATITIVLGEVVTGPPVVAAAPLPRTGADTDRLLVLAGALLLLGGLLVAADGGWVPVPLARRRRC